MSDSSYDTAQVISATDSGFNAYAQDPITFSVSTSAVFLLSLNPNRAFAIIQNLGSPLYIKLGVGASTASYAVRLDANQILSLDRYCGIVSAVRLNTTDNVIVTEVA